MAFLLVLVSFCIVEATMHHGAYDHEVSGAGLRTVHLAIVFLGDVLRVLAWRGLVVVMGFRWCSLMTVALMLYYSLLKPEGLRFLEHTMLFHRFTVFVSGFRPS